MTPPPPAGSTTPWIDKHALRVVRASCKAPRNAASSVVLAKNEVGADYAKLGSAEANLTLTKSRLELAVRDYERGQMLNYLRIAR